MRDNDTMQLCAQIVPTLAKDVPVLLVVGALEDNRPDLDSRQFVGSTTFRDSFGTESLPVAPKSIHPSDLLFDDTGIPLRVQQQNDSASSV